MSKGKFVKKLDAWKSGAASSGGRLTLVNFCLSTCPWWWTIHIHETYHSRHSPSEETKASCGLGRSMAKHRLLRRPRRTTRAPFIKYIQRSIEAKKRRSVLSLCSGGFIKLMIFVTTLSALLKFWTVQFMRCCRYTTLGEHLASLCPRQIKKGFSRPACTSRCYVAVAIPRADLQIWQEVSKSDIQSSSNCTTPHYKTQSL
jgi:hypothetical protein